MNKRIISAAWTLGLCLYANAQSPVADMLRALPVLDCTGSEIHYQGSIDKTGGNADWDWYLYQDDNGEWVVLDIDGPGCIDNITQHRYLTCTDPLFRFYLDGSTEPQYQVRLSQLGIDFPFSRPLADSYIGPYDNGRGPIRVARSFVPIRFSRGCKVTTDVRLFGNNRDKGESGWGHIIYHTYSQPQDSSGTPQENTEDIRILKTRGYTLPESGSAGHIKIVPTALMPGDSCTIANINHAAVINAIRLFASKPDSTSLQNVWIQIAFDSHSQPDILCPIGAFFGNSLGLNSTEYLLMGVNVNGLMYNTFPMPFFENSKIKIFNLSHKPFDINGGMIELSDNAYTRSSVGYLRNTPYYNRTHTPGADSRIGRIDGGGKMVGAHITCWAERPNLISCEGDVHVYIDDERSPRVQSDGSESYVSFGWGFPTPPETHPFGGYDGLPDNPWSMTRLCIFDNYPFYSNLTFNIESGEHNNQYLEHAGTIFYYSSGRSLETLTDSICLADKNSTKQHCCHIDGKHSLKKTVSVFEGTYNQRPLEMEYMTYGNGSSLTFRVKIDPVNNGVKLLRTSYRKRPCQRAQVFVDGMLVDERDWYYADNNEHMSWLDDSFTIPSKYTLGKSEIRIRIVPQTHIHDTTPSWTDTSYRVYSLIAPADG